MINNFKNFLLKENSNKEVNFVKFNDNVYKLSINGDVIGSTYLQDAKKFTMFKSIIDLLPVMWYRQIRINKIRRLYGK